MAFLKKEQEIKRGFSEQEEPLIIQEDEKNEGVELAIILSQDEKVPGGAKKIKTAKINGSFTKNEADKLKNLGLELELDFTDNRTRCLAIFLFITLRGLMLVGSSGGVMGAVLLFVAYDKNRAELDKMHDEILVPQPLLNNNISCIEALQNDTSLLLPCASSEKDRHHFNDSIDPGPNSQGVCQPIMENYCEALRVADNGRYMSFGGIVLVCVSLGLMAFSVLPWGGKTSIRRYAMRENSSKILNHLGFFAVRGEEISASDLLKKMPFHQRETKEEKGDLKNAISLVKGESLEDIPTSLRVLIANYIWSLPLADTPLLKIESVEIEPPLRELPEEKNPSFR